MRSVSSDFAEIGWQLQAWDGSQPSCGEAQSAPLRQAKPSGQQAWELRQRSDPSRPLPEPLPQTLTPNVSLIPLTSIPSRWLLLWTQHRKGLRSTPPRSDLSTHMTRRKRRRRMLYKLWHTLYKVSGPVARVPPLCQLDCVSNCACSRRALRFRFSSKDPPQQCSG